MEVEDVADLFVGPVGEPAEDVPAPESVGLHDCVDRLGEMHLGKVSILSSFGEGFLLGLVGFEFLKKVLVHDFTGTMYVHARIFPSDFESLQPL
jgi:hypothetical protein